CNLDFFYFFFSSRRRHTRFSRDWSSDVCSSDLDEFAWIVDSEPSLPWLIAFSMVTISSPSTSPTITRDGFIRSERRTSSAIVTRSEERRVGKESGYRWCGWRIDKRATAMRRELG